VLEPDVYVIDPGLLAPELPLELVDNYQRLAVEGDEGRREALAHPDGEARVVAYVDPGEEEEGVGAPAPHPLDDLFGLLLVEV